LSKLIFVIFTFCVVDADVDGNIGYQLSGKIPLRVPGHDGSAPVLGNGTFDWTGFVNFDETPHTYNPPRGYIATANEKVVPNTYPYLVLNEFDDTPAYRGIRIRELITAASGAISVDYMRTIHSDWKRYAHSLF
jgi:penicillin amidase